MKKIHMHFFLFIAVIWTYSVQSQNVNLTELDAKVASYIPQNVNDKTPGLVLGIVHKGELILSKSYGLANVAYGIPNSAELVYNIGSVSKQFLGYAFAMLQVEGKIDLDDAVGKYLDDWPEFEQTVTIRHLLSHTSGYREAYTMSSLAGREVGVDRLTRKECLDVVRKQPKLEFTPGSRFTYNSTAWVILAEILEKVTAQAADIWVEENILRPLGMDHTYIESFVGEVIPNAAESYQSKNPGEYENSKSNRAIFGAADVSTSINDMVFWLNNFRNVKVGNQKVMDVFLEPFILNDGSNSEYALGINNNLHRGLKCYQHTGGHASFITQLRYYPEHELGIFTVSNFGGSAYFPTNKIAEYMLSDFMKTKDVVKRPPFKMNKKELKKFVGVYLSPIGNASNRITMLEDSLFIWGGSKLVPISANSFYVKDWGGTFEINTLKDGTLRLDVLGDSKSSFDKVDAWEPTKEDLKVYEGDYWSDELETVYHVKIMGDNLTMQHRWLGEIPMTPLTKDWFTAGWEFYVQIVRNEKNDVVGFKVNSSRTLDVFFQRQK